jgi:type I restriction enzyme R subunit
MNMTLSAIMSDPDMDNEDKINAMCEGKKLLTNASYFAFTATPKNKTLETFGTAYEDAGVIKHRPFHVYTMKQAIQEGFILDVLKYYTPIDSYYRLKKTVEDDPMFDKKKAQKKLRAFVENQTFTIAQKADMMVSHFHEQVIAKGKIGGQARAMIITSSIEYYHAVNKCLANRHSPYKAIIAFSGEKQLDKDAAAVTSAGLNGFPDAAIPKTFKKDPYRFLIVADMFQTGYDEPLLHTMYVDKQLYDIKAVQTLSRLNRACPKKYDTFVLDFFNDPNDIIDSFSRYYKTTLLSGETDPNKLYDLIADMESYQVFSDEHVEQLVNRYLDGADRDQLDPALDACASVYKQLDTDGQIKFKSAAKGFVRTYGFLSAILPYGNPEWEKLSIFLNMLIPKLPSPQEDDLSQGILEAIDLDSYRIEKKETISLILPDEDAEVGPVPMSTAKGKQEPEMDVLSAILSDFNDMFGNIDWNDADNVRRQILEIPAMVSRDEQYQNAMRNSDKQGARTESDRVLQKVIFSIMADNMELFKQYTDNQDFKKWLSDLVFNLTYNKNGKPYQPQK